MVTLRLGTGSYGQESRSRLCRNSRLGVIALRNPKWKASAQAGSLSWKSPSSVLAPCSDALEVSCPFAEVTIH